MSNFLREGDKVYMTHNMGVKGVVTEVFYKSVTANIGPGTLAKQMWVKFVNTQTEQILIAKRQDLTKDNT
jgi:ABC-type phosphate transport system ATPase subunit